ncbi:uncharacterized protein LOC128417380 isoform X2 [Podarcis raffonei]|nr:uncharacterized protein LOC128417380 isoform X2 [Podarcis raffonei]
MARAQGGCCCCRRKEPSTPGSGQAKGASQPVARSRLTSNRGPILFFSRFEKNPPAPLHVPMQIRSSCRKDRIVKSIQHLILTDLGPMTVSMLETLCTSKAACLRLTPITHWLGSVRSVHQRE